MTKLYMKAKSDTHTTFKTMTGNNDMSITVYHGSRNNSKQLININIVYGDKPDIPVIFIDGVRQWCKK